MPSGSSSTGRKIPNTPGSRSTGDDTTAVDEMAELSALPIDELQRLVVRLEQEMRLAATELRYEEAALLRDDIQMDIDFYAALKPTLDGGKARIIATSAPQRSPELPNVPTVQEGGVANFEVTAWNGLYAPAGTPDAIIATLNQVLHDVLDDPDLKKRALDLGIDAKASTPAELDARMRGDIEKWGKVIAQAGIAKQ